MCTEGYRWHRGDAGGTGGVQVAPGAAAARGGALQYCDSVTRGPHAPSPTRAGDTDTAVEGGEPTQGTPRVAAPRRDLHPAPTSGITRALRTHPFTSNTAP